MKQIKSLKKQTLRRKGYIEIDNITLPIHTRGMSEFKQALREVKANQSLPLKLDIANTEEKKAMKNLGIDIGSFNVSIKRIDETDEKYLQFQEKLEKYDDFITIAIHVDLKYPIGDIELWEDIGLKNEKDYYGMAIWLSELGMFSSDRNAILEKIQQIKKSSIKEYDDWDVEDNAKS